MRGVVGGSAVVRRTGVARGAVGVGAGAAVGGGSGGGYDAVASTAAAAAAAAAVVGEVEAVERVGSGGGGVAICAAQTVWGDAAAWVWLLVDNLEVLVFCDLLFAHFEARALRRAREMNEDAGLGWFVNCIGGW